MSEQLDWALLGYKPDQDINIGHEVTIQIARSHERLGLKPLSKFVMRTSGLMRPDGKTPYGGGETLAEIDDFPDVIFVALSPTEDGEPIFSHVMTGLDRGALVATVEKSALAEADKFAAQRDASDNFNRYGINGTFSGGVRLLEVSQPYLRDHGNISQIHISPNGTLTHNFSAMGPLDGTGMSSGQAVQQAVKLGFAEPGAKDVFSVIRQEAERDVPRKIAIFMNYTGLAGDQLLDWRDFKYSLSDSQIKEAIQDARVRRFIVSVYPANHSDISGPEEDIIGRFDIPHGRWRIVGGFRHIDRNPLMRPLAELTGPGNGIVIGLGPNETDGTYAVTGPGAGPEPTVNALLDDYLRLKDRAA